MSSRALAHAAMLLFVALVSTSFTVGVRISPALDPVALTFVRFFFAAFVFAGICVVGKVTIRWPRLQDLIRYAWLAFLLVLYFTTMFEALRLASAFSVGVVFTFAPLFTAIVSRVFLGQRLSVAQWSALVVAGLGSLWVVSGANWQQLLQLNFGPGEQIFLIGTAAYASYAPSVRYLHQGESLLSLTFWTTILGAVMLGVYGYSALSSAAWTTLGAPVWLGIAHLVVACTVITFYLIQYASLHLPSAKVMAYVYLTPVCVALYEALLGNGWPEMPVWFGVLLIVIAMLTLQLFLREPTQDE